jgi:hypothetical protein
MAENETPRGNGAPQTNCNPMIPPPPLVAWTGPDIVVFHLADDPRVWSILVAVRTRMLQGERRTA